MMNIDFWKEIQSYWWDKLPTKEDEFRISEQISELGSEWKKQKIKNPYNINPLLDEEEDDDDD